MGSVIRRGPSQRWRDAQSPDLAVFQDLAGEAFEALPEAFRALCGAIEIRVADFAEDEVLDSLGMEDPFLLMGLFEGVGMAQDASTPFTGQMPNRIWLYRRAILDYWADHDDTLGEVVAHVLVHEIGHHFGLSDDDMEAIEASAP